MKAATIAAPATSPGRAAIAVVRLSGPDITPLIASRLGRVLEHRRATRVTWRDRDGRALDDAVATFWKGPASYTGEDVLELSLHGNPLLVRAVLEDLAAAGIRLADRGEFTRRALDHGKLTLAQAEAVATMVAAETRSGLAAARYQLQGGLDVAVGELRQKLLEASALMELETDFAEEEDTPDASHILPALREVREKLAHLCAAQEKLARRGAAPRVVLAGHPNAGKSSLVNALLGEDRLLVSPVRGTTRDWVEVPLIFPEGEVTLVDTAGLGPAQDALDAAAQEHSRRELARAHLVLVLVEAGRALDAEERTLLALPGREVELLRTKGDLHGEAAALSVKTGTGVQELRERLHGLLEDEDGTETVALGTARSLAAARASEDDLNHAVTEATAGRIELAAWHTRHALENLRDLVGEIPNEEVLGAIFSKFCIGK